MKRIKNPNLLLIIILLMNSCLVWSQTSTFELYYDEANDNVSCSQTVENGAEVSSSKVLKNRCLENPGSLLTPIRYILSDTGKCLAYIDVAPFYFIGEVSDLSRCSNNGSGSTSEIDRSFNVIKYSQHEVTSICSELGECLNILGSRSQDLVDNTVSVLEEIAIKSEMQSLRNSAEQDRLNFVLPEFNRKLDQLRVENQRCQSNLSYGSGDQLAARDALASDLREISGTLEEDLYVFHWYAGLGSALTNSSEGGPNVVARTHARMLQDNYFGWDSSEGTGMQGRGLYASDGPRTTENYGSNLLRIRIPAGSRYLNMASGTRKSSVIPLSSRTVDALRLADCELGGSGFRHAVRSADGGMDVNKIAFSNNRSCRRIYNSVIINEDYKFHSYSFASRQSSICQGETRTAFVLIQNEMSAENVMAFNSPFDDRDAMSDEARDLFDLARDASRMTPQRRDELSEEYGDHLWRCRSDNQH
jgi:hypothetical protein